MASEKRGWGGCIVGILAVVLPLAFLAGAALGAGFSHMLPFTRSAALLKQAEFERAKLQALYDQQIEELEARHEAELKAASPASPSTLPAEMPQPGASSPHVTLLTDYGTDSLYVGLLTGAIHAGAPGAAVSSITNAIPPYDIAAGAYTLAEGCVTFPPDTVFCCVVDPGVGTSRRPLAMETNNGWRFVAPDNGLLTLVAQQFGVKEVRELSNSNLWRVKDTSTTFHGRDIFGPVAGALASGTPFAEVGNVLNDFVKLELPVGRVENGAATGEVVRVDTYGNLVTNIPGEALAQLGINKGDGVDIAIGDDQYGAPYVATYGEVPPGDRLVVVQSAGFVELAANMNNLAGILQENLHAPVTLRKAAATP